MKMRRRLEFVSLGLALALSCSGGESTTADVVESVSDDSTDAIAGYDVCVPQCTHEGGKPFEWGDDGWGGSCGECPKNEMCEPEMRECGFFDYADC